VSLTIDQGELAAIVGPPGSGKTTLVHLWPGRGRGRRAPSRAFTPIPGGVGQSLIGWAAEKVAGVGVGHRVGVVDV
jgi:ABC-type uncharacterized transport system ATPase subunit